MSYKPRQWFFNAKGEASKVMTPDTIFVCTAVTFKEAKQKFDNR